MYLGGLRSESPPSENFGVYVFMCLCVVVSAIRERETREPGEDRRVSGLRAPALVDREPQLFVLKNKV